MFSIYKMLYLIIFNSLTLTIFISQSNPVQLSFAFHIETSHLFCSAKQLTGYYMKWNTEKKNIKKIETYIFFK